MRDLKDNIDAVIALTPVGFGTTGTGSYVDLSGYDSAMIVITSGTMGATGTGVLPSLVESTDGTTGTAVAAGNLVGSFSNIGTGVATSTQRVGYVGSKRYIAPVFTGLGGTGAVLLQLSAVVLRGHPNRRPLA